MDCSASKASNSTRIRQDDVVGKLKLKVERERKGKEGGRFAGPVGHSSG